MRIMVAVAVVVALLISSPPTVQAGPILESAVARAARAAMAMQPMGRASLGRNRMKVAVGIAVLATGAFVAVYENRGCPDAFRYNNGCFKHGEHIEEFARGLIYNYDGKELYVPSPDANDKTPYWLKNEYDDRLWAPEKARIRKGRVGAGLAVAAVGAYLIGWWAQPEELLSISVGPRGVGVQKRVGF